MNAEKLVRGLGRWDFTAIVINSIVGAGIFGLPAKAYGHAGSFSIFAMLVCALVIALILLCYAEVSSRFDSTGGPYLYARRAFGPAVGFEVGWLYWIVRVSTFAANCNLMIMYLTFFVPGANEGWLRIGFVSLTVSVITIVNLIGIRETAVMTNIFTVGKLVALLVFVGAGIFFIEPGRFNFDAAPGYSSFSTAALLLIYAFVGFEASVVLAGETRHPSRSLPFGLVTGLAVVTVFYVAVQIVAIGTLPTLAISERAIADAASITLGSFGASLVTVGVAVSVFGNINVGVLSASRLLFAMSEQGDLPGIFEKTHPRFKTPYIALLTTAGVIFILTIQSTFLTAVAIATITRLLVYATTCGALIVFRRRGRLPPAPFSVPFGVAAAVLSMTLILWLLTNVDYTKEGLPIIVSAAVGFIIYTAVRFFGHPKHAVERPRTD